MRNTDIGAYAVNYRLINTSYYTIQTLLTSNTMKVKGKIEILAGYHTNKSVKLLSRVKKRCGENALATKVQYHRWKFPLPINNPIIFFSFSSNNISMHRDVGCNEISENCPTLKKGQTAQM